MHGRSLLTGLALASFLVGCGGGSDMPSGPSGGGNTVTVGNNFFSPASLTVPLNSTVTWSWAQGAVQHNVTFDDGAPGSGPQSTGTFQRTFGAAGTFGYFCSIHGKNVMSGSITVGTGTSTGGGGGGGGTGGGGAYP
jgi:plastocyanin